ncbi:hypothetical protein DFH06DRAFT_1324906 [Mycena polygramma]|nr:hypothetical protein DFH06DRAFT_1324906 [Mycena polygramma]
MSSADEEGTVAPFLNLPPDVVFSIFAHCDISTVLYTSQSKTCRYLHDLAFNKSVWLALVDNLRRRSMLDQNRTPSLENLSTEEFVEVVKRLVTGPATWSPENSDSVAEVHATITLYPAVRTGAGILHWENVVKLLPNGRHLLFKNWTTLECWNVADDRLVWTHKSNLKHASVLEFAAEETGGVDALIVMVCLRTYPPGAHSERKKAECRIRFLARAFDNPFSVPLIRGALAVVATSEQQDSYMILNWKTKSYIMLKCRPVRHNALLLIPEHLILKTPSIPQDENDEEDEIHIIAHDALRAHWAPTSSIGPTGDFASVWPHNLQKLSTIATPMKLNKWGDFSVMSVPDSPLRDGEYRLWVHAFDGTGHPVYVGALVGYQITLGWDGEPPRWRCLGLVTPLTPAHYRSQIPYSGHILSLQWSPVFRISPTRSSTLHATVDLPHSGNCVDVARYSGALTYSTHESIVVTYFK